MKRVVMVVMLLMALVVSPLMADTVEGFKVNPNDQVLITLLTMVVSDLEMCRGSMKDKFIDNLMAIGHLNNAQSALKRSDLDPAYNTLVSEINERISKIKFYLVMNDLQNVQMRLNQLIAVIRATIGANAGNGGIYIPGYPGESRPWTPPSGNPEQSPREFPPNGGVQRPDGGVINLPNVNR